MGVITMRKVANVTVLSICKGNFNIGCVTQYIQKTVNNYNRGKLDE
jgi:hypothetical protein